MKTIYFPVFCSADLFFFEEEAKRKSIGAFRTLLFCLLVKKKKSAEQFVIGRADYHYSPQKIAMKRT